MIGTISWFLSKSFCANALALGVGLVGGIFT